MPWTAARQASLSVTNSWSLLKLKSIESVMLLPPNHFTLCLPLLLHSICPMEGLSPRLQGSCSGWVSRVSQSEKHSHTRSVFLSPSTKSAEARTFQIHLLEGFRLSSLLCRRVALHQGALCVSVWRLWVGKQVPEGPSTGRKHEWVPPLCAEDFSN